MTLANATTHSAFIAQLEAQQAALGLSDQTLSEALGFERPITLTLIKQGTMRLPLTKIPGLAAVLELEPAELFSAALRESDPALGKVIDEVFNPLRLCATEVTLITHLRGLCGDRNVSPIVFDGKGVLALVA